MEKIDWNKIKTEYSKGYKKLNDVSRVLEKCKELNNEIKPISYEQAEEIYGKERFDEYIFIDEKNGNTLYFYLVSKDVHDLEIRIFNIKNKLSIKYNILLENIIYEKIGA
jgi:hypothetical protein